MDKERAKIVFQKLYDEYKPNCPIPMNKQKGDKKAVAYLSAIINMIIERCISTYNYTCDYDPRELTTITTNGFPTRTLARRVDGAFPGPVNPIAIWEIKEGSRLEQRLFSNNF